MSNNFGGIPIGGIISWHKSFSATPPTKPYGWVECNGQTITDANSIYNGQTVPDLNSTQRFLRGASSSGGTSGSDTHSHTVNSTTLSSNAIAGVSTTVVISVSASTSSESTLPTYFEVVFLIKIK